MTDRQHDTPATGTKIGRGLNDLLDGVVGIDADVKHGVASAHSQVQDASAVLRESVARLQHAEDEAWRHYAAEVDQAMAQMQAELSSAETQLRVEEAQSNDQLSVALHQVADMWRSRADELRVQIRLGQMEAHDAGLQALDVLERAGHEVGALIDETRQGSAATISILRERTASIVEEVREALRGVATTFRADSSE